MRDGFYRQTRPTRPPWILYMEIHGLSSGRSLSSHHQRQSVTRLCCQPITCSHVEKKKKKTVPNYVFALRQIVK